MYAGYLASTQKLTFKILEATDEVGGQIKLYQDKPIYDMASYDMILGKDLIHNLHQQLIKKESDAILHNQEVISIHKNDDHFVVTTKIDKFESKFVILASGGGLLSPKPLGIANEANYENVYYSVKDAKFFENKRLAIFGGGDSALDWAHYFMQKGSRVSLIHRRDTFRGQEALVDEIKNDVNIYAPYQLVTIEGKKHITSITIKHTESDTIITIEVDDVFVFYGQSPSKSLRDLPIEILEKGYKVSHAMETSLRNLYAIGNMASYPSKVYMIITGLGEAATAISDITSKLNPKKKMSYGSMT
jgi:thioredoxin reductase (NADPH)